MKIEAKVKNGQIEVEFKIEGEINGEVIEKVVSSFEKLEHHSSSGNKEEKKIDDK